MGYVEKDCPRTALRGLRPYERFLFSWFDPCSGTFREETELCVNCVGMIPLPAYPGDQDWAFKLKKMQEPYSIDTSEHPKTCWQEYVKQKEQIGEENAGVLNESDNKAYDGERACAE